MPWHSCVLWWKQLQVGVWFIVWNNVLGCGSGGDRQEDGESGTWVWERGVGNQGRARGNGAVGSASIAC